MSNELPPEFAPAAGSSIDLLNAEAMTLVQLQSRERLLTAMYENTPHCVKLVAPDGTLLDMNQAGLRFIEADDLTFVRGQDAYQFVAPEHRDAFREFNRRVCDGGKETLQFEIIGLRGARRWMNSTAVPLELADGSVVQLAISHDITIGKRRQAELENAKESAETANRAKSEFLANLSHEIRTPMTAILGFSEMLLDNVTRPENLEFARTIKENGHYLLKLINDILDLSKIEAGKLSVELVSCSPRTIIGEVEALMQVRAAAKALPLEFCFEGPIPDTMQSDPLRLRQVLINIIGNSIKFTETGRVKIVTRLHNGASPQLEFRVIDTGIGIDASKIEMLFEPFTQADSSTTRRFGGTGLGLAISRRLARFLGGDISVQSELGRGSTFIIRVATGPLNDVRTTQFVGPHQHSAGAQLDGMAIASERLNCRVLLVEDGPDNQRLIGYILKKSGARIRVADNGRVALQLIAEDPEAFDVVLMDMQMPEVDGYEATRRLREEGFDKPIIALTAHAMAEDRKKCLDAGCDDYTSKPIDRKQLIELVARFTKHGRSAHSQQHSAESPVLD